MNIISTRARLGLAVQHTDGCFKKWLSCRCRGREGPPFLCKDTLSFEDVPRDRFSCDFSGTSGLLSLPMVYVTVLTWSKALLTVDAIFEVLWLSQLLMRS